MHDPFNYPSLAFGAEGMALGTMLNRYQSFRNEESESTDDRSDPKPPPGADDENPPNGGSESSTTQPIGKVLLGTAAVGLVFYVAHLVNSGDLIIDMPTYLQG